MKVISIAVTVTIVLLIGSAGKALAAGESASVKAVVSPVGEGFFESVSRPAKLKLEASVTPPQEATETRVMNSVSFDLPPAINGRTNKPPTCPNVDEVILWDFEGRVIPHNLPAEPIYGMRLACPRSVVGVGEATLHPDGVLTSGNELIADLLVVFADEYVLGGRIFAIIGQFREDAPEHAAGFILKGFQPLDAGFAVLMEDKDVRALGFTDLKLDMPGGEGDPPAVFGAYCPEDPFVVGGSIIVSEAAGDSQFVLNSPRSNVPCSGAPDPRHTVTVIRDGDGSGTVTSPAKGIDCGTDCAELVRENEFIRLDAHPDPGSYVAGWSYCPYFVDFACLVPGDADRTVRATFRREPPTPPAGRPGVSINAGARFTRHREVTLSVVWPWGARDAVIANDGSFADALSVALAPTIPWRLDTGGPERIQRTVYVRFDDSLETLSDDIVLDRTPPVVRSASATRRGRSKRVVVRVRARDATSGVARIQAGPRRGALPRVKFSRRLSIFTSRHRIWIRVFDRAGNPSRWKRVRVG